jgi:hypothetical protein
MRVKIVQADNAPSCFFSKNQQWASYKKNYQHSVAGEKKKLLESKKRSVKTL